MTRRLRRTAACGLVAVGYNVKHKAAPRDGNRRGHDTEGATSMPEQDYKLCVVCGTRFDRPQRRSQAWWDARRSCSHSCASRLRHRPTLAERLWANVEKNGPISAFRPDLGPCWQWVAPLHKGYGRLFNVAGGERLAHRISYILAGNVIPEGLTIDHLCRNRRCVNPAHLEPVTPVENTRRGLKGVLNTHCVNGHEYTPENTALTSDGTRRRCRDCRRAACRRRRAALKTAAATPEEVDA